MRRDDNLILFVIAGWLIAAIAVDSLSARGWWESVFISLFLGLFWIWPVFGIHSAWQMWRNKQEETAILRRHGIDRRK